MFRRLALATLAAAALAAATTPVALAQWPGSDWQDNRGGRDRDRGGGDEQEVPLGRIQRDLRDRFGGQMLDARKQGSTYIVSWVDGSGRRLTIDVDARTGRVLSVR